MRSGSLVPYRTLPLHAQVAPSEAQTVASALLPPRPPEPTPVKIAENAGQSPACCVDSWYRHDASSDLSVPASSCTPANDPAYPFPDAQVPGFPPPMYAQPDSEILPSPGRHCQFALSLAVVP